MNKRQAFEVAAEIEAKWRRSSRRVLASWSFEHVSWLLQRWQFKRPQDVEQRKRINDIVTESVGARLKARLTVNWLYVFNGHIRAMMEGAGLDTSEPVSRQRVVDDSVIELTSTKSVLAKEV